MGSANNLTVNAAGKGTVVNKNIYGHFSEHLGRCIYGGLFAGEGSDIPNTNGMRNDVVQALRNIKIPVLRWPGGCFADEYHWKDGIGPKPARKRMVNTHWGGVVEDNSFGTHEFMELCEQLGCEPYINGNVGSGTVQEMSEWVEYMTFGGVSPMSELRAKNGRKEPWTVKYFGIGNENWGCGGNMRPEFYGDLYRQFQTYVRNYGDNKVYKIAGGPHDDDYEWTDAVMKVAAKYMDALTMHYYTIPGTWQKKGSATGFTVDEYYTTLQKAADIERLILNHLHIMNRYDPEHKVGLIIDEWGSWYEVEPDTNPGFLYQQNTMRDALIAALSLNIFNRHSDRIVMTNIAQTVNVLQAVVLTEGPKMVLTPTYHVYDLYKSHQDAVLLDTWLDSPEACGGLPALSVSATKKDQTITVTVANVCADDAQEVNCSVAGAALDSVSGRILSGKTDAFNDFSDPERVTLRAFDGIQKTAKDNGISFTMPPCSVAEITLQCRA